MALSRDVKDDSYLGDPSWGLGLSPRGNLVLKVNLVCGPTRRSKVMGAGPAHVKDQASAPTVGWLTGTVPDTSYLRFFFFCGIAE